MRIKVNLIRFAVLLCGFILGLGGRAEALPIYAQRSGRTCANCHESPTLEDPKGWDNPKLMDRKCTMSCVACHVNPTGGGLRNTSGRYYAQSTLSIFGSQERSYSDRRRELASEDRLWRVRQFLGDEPSTHDPSGRTVPSDGAEVEAGIGAGQTGGWQTGLRPLGRPSKMAFWDGRYGDLQADPALNGGADLRFAYWSGTQVIFPMQVDLHGAVHPVEHLTLMATAAARGRSTGIVDAAASPQGPIFARNAFILAHELPGMSWAKAGVFMPAFGSYGDDHTAFVRQLFEQDVSTSDDGVLGVEVGTAPNYPYATLSLFQNDTSFMHGGELDPGWGGAAQAGWRDLGWSLGAHAMVKQRGGLGRGDLLAGGLVGGFNPAYYLEGLPLTLLGELSLGRRTLGASERRFAAAALEAWWILWNGVSLRGRADVGWMDLSDRREVQQRSSLGVEISPVPGVSFTAFGRMLFVPGGHGGDIFVQTHFWF